MTDAQHHHIQLFMCVLRLEVRSSHLQGKCFHLLKYLVSLVCVLSWNSCGYIRRGKKHFTFPNLCSSLIASNKVWFLRTGLTDDVIWFFRSSISIHKMKIILLNTLCRHLRRQTAFIIIYVSPLAK